MADVKQLDWLEDSVGVLALHDRAILSVSGDDALDWLQGQLSNQLEGIESGESRYAFVLTLKGRILADVYLLARENELWLDVPAGQVAALLDRFERYIIMEDVEIEHQADLRVVAAQGPRASEMPDGGWPADRLGTGGRQWLVTDDALDSQLARLAERALELGGGAVDEQAWAEAHVLVGRPRFGVDFGDWTYPQESGLNPLAVSFNKGCYIGQETVVMLQNRGKAPKVLWRWAIEGTQAPAAKSPILSDESVVGEVTSAIALEQGVLALGFLKRGHESNTSEGFTIAGQAAQALGSVESGAGVARSHA